MFGLNDYINVWQNEKDYSWESFWLMFGTFLDSFYLKKDFNMLKEKPNYNTDVPIEIKAFIAASVDYLCDGVNSPKWVKDNEHILKKPFFPSGLKGPIRAVMLIESPIEFKVRNIYVTADVLKRV